MKPKRTAPANAAETVEEPRTVSDNPTEWITVAAYFRAEQRGFEQGHELDDWLQAEKELNDLIMGRVQ